MIISDAGYGIQRYTYADVLKYCRRYAAYFQRTGIKAGDRIVTVLPNSAEAVLCFFSAMMMGIDYAPLPCTVTQREFDKWLSIVRPALIVRKSGIAEYESTVRTVDCICDGDLSWIGEDEFSDCGAEHTSHICLMTSGTTGEPKAMLIDAERLWRSGDAFISCYGLKNSGVRFWNYLPMSYLGGLFNLAIIPLCCGGSFVISEPFSGKTILNFWNFVKKHSITALWFVPSIIQGLLKLSDLVGKNVYGDTCDSIRIAFLGTAPIMLDQKNGFEEVFGIRLYENFALSETTFLTAENRDDIRFREESSVGLPLPYASVKIVPIDANEKIGTIWVKTPYLFSGYLSENGDIEIETDGEGYFNTKDLGHFNEDGILVLDGRERDIIKKGGLFVSLPEIERLVSKYPAVEEIVAAAEKHEFYGECYNLYVKFRMTENRDRQIKELQMWMLENVVSYKMPERIVAVRDFPRTASGKIQKRKLLSDEGAWIDA